MGQNRIPPSQRREKQSQTPPKGTFKVMPAKPNGQTMLPPVRLRDACAEAVHRAVCEFSGSPDGFGHCQLYALAGHLVISIAKLNSSEVNPQAGTLMVASNPDDPTLWMTLSADDGGLSRGEFHSWLASEDGTIVDFTARHYRNYAERLVHIPGDETHPGWKRGDPPTYLWCHHSELPEWVKFRSDFNACRQNANMTVAGKENIYKPLGRLAYRHYRALTD